MKIDYENLKNEVIWNLEKNKTWVLSTTSNGNI